MSESKSESRNASKSELIVASQFDPRVNQLLAQRTGLAVHDVPPGPLTQLPPGADVLFVLPAPNGQTLLQTPAPWGWDKVRWVQLASVGIDYYPDWLFDGPVVTSARGTASISIAEYVLAAIFSAAKRIPDIWLKQAADWRRLSLGLVQGSTLGLYGFGSIGQALAQRALALGIKVIALRRSDTPLEVDGVERVATLEELLQRSDHLVLAAPSTAETRHAINRASLKHARAGLHLINIARGNLVDHQALLDALDEGKLALATLDVTDPEPLPAGHAFYSHPQVRLSPHISPSTDQIVPALIDKFVLNLDRFRSGKPLADVVDTARGY
ncbi:D-isomer specific 2-hydroxyacid dehydrogenase family protein [Undibacterium sp. Ji49W]|uniref:D-isomer specific 2-hydroxyacid dehydrogenase family protein n=1 Tax=Undibacterium sp. Ji49W TaxID=3413040 RepID=UPI003BF22575